MPMSVHGLRETFHVITLVLESPTASRQKMRCRAGWQSGCFDCRLPNVFAICHLPSARGEPVRDTRKDDK